MFRTRVLILIALTVVNIWAQTSDNPHIFGKWDRKYLVASGILACFAGANNIEINIDTTCDMIKIPEACNGLVSCVGLAVQDNLPYSPGIIIWDETVDMLAFWGFRVDVNSSKTLF